MRNGLKKVKDKIKIIGIVFGIGIGILNIFGKLSKKKALKDDDLKKDCYEGAGTKTLNSKRTFYDVYIKRFIDIILSSIGIIVLSPLFLILAVIIYIDDPGPIFFSQKRVGVYKTFFKLYKFRSMKMSTPSDMPTHMLADPEQYITRVGKILRKYSLDELPQFYNILVGDISIVGPRPALWNQEDLVAERDKYGANDVMPGLTGWAQINGRDELEIEDKAKLDGEYVEKLRKNSITGLIMDVKCFLGTVTSVLRSDGVIEGGTGNMKKEDIELSLFKTEKNISASIVTYNSKDEIDEVLQSIENNECFNNINLFVVDNHSLDGTSEYIKENYPWVNVITNNENLGFGKAHNIVIKNVKSEIHLIINPDIIVHGGCIKDALDYMNNNPEVAVMCPRVFNVDGTEQFLPKRNPSLKYMVGGLFDTKLKLCKRIRDEYTMKDEGISSPIEVEFCTGAFMITRTSMLQNVGGFDERYFLHFEDADLTRELIKEGRAIYNPNLEVTHKWHRDNKKLNKSFFVALKSLFIYMTKWM